VWTAWVGEVIHVMIINNELDMEEKILSAIRKA
jgi:hypothetical protein